MESKAKLAGHPVHPMLVVFPLGLFATSLIFDLIWLFASSGVWSLVSEYMIGAGIVGGLLAAVFGTIDWVAIPRNTRAKTIGLWHGGGNVVVTAMFVASWLLRRPTPADPPAAAMILSAIGVVLALGTGWLGGELVDRLGVGVDDGANLNAPSSLSGRQPSDRRVA
jgi:uncharacterized membrane protein